MTTTSYPEGFVEMVDAKDNVVKAEGRTEVAAALLTIERRINSATYWILSVVVGAAGIIIAVLK